MGEYLPQHKKLAMTGDLGQELAASKTGATGKPSDQKDKSPLMDGNVGGSDTTLSPGSGGKARSPW